MPDRGPLEVLLLGLREQDLAEVAAVIQGAFKVVATSGKKEGDGGESEAGGAAEEDGFPKLECAVTRRVLKKAELRGFSWSAVQSLKSGSAKKGPATNWDLVVVAHRNEGRVLLLRPRTESWSKQ